MIHTLIGLVAVFFGRHWLVAISNAALTAALGLGLLRWASRWRGLELSPLDVLRLRRSVVLCALYKGALFLLLGVSFHHRTHFPLICGIQIPSPLDLLCLIPAGADSVWNPTSASKWVSLLLLGMASVFLVRRSYQLVKSKHALRTLLYLGKGVSDERVSTVLRRAATALRLPPSYALPVVILAEVPHPTPMLVGLRRPYLLLSPRLAEALTDPELEMAFRHELTHFVRHDQWWRWPFTWLEDVGRLNLLSGPLGDLALDIEEELCDRCSVHTPQEALILAAAIRKSVNFYLDGLYQDELPASVMGLMVKSVTEEKSLTGRTWQKARTPDTPVAAQDAAATQSLYGGNDFSADAISLPSVVLPALLGRHTRKWSRPASLCRRLQGLLSLAEDDPTFVTERERPSPQGLPSNKGSLSPARHALLRFCGRFGLSILLFLIVYVKFYVAVAVFYDQH